MFHVAILKYRNVSRRLNRFFLRVSCCQKKSENKTQISSWDLWTGEGFFVPLTNINNVDLNEALEGRFRSFPAISPWIGYFSASKSLSSLLRQKYIKRILSSFHLICHLPFIRPRKTVAVFVVETDSFLFCVSVRFPCRGLAETRSKWGKKSANSRMSWPEGERRLALRVGQKLHMDNNYQK